MHNAKHDVKSVWCESINARRAIESSTKKSMHDQLSQFIPGGGVFEIFRFNTD